MTKIGGKGHTKRHASPRMWPIHRKEEKFVITTEPGPHPKSESIPLLLLLRDYWKYVTNRSEAVYVLSQGLVLVDGRVKKSPSHGVGYMDVISIPSIGIHYRIVYTKKGLRPIEISEEEANYKLCKIRNKTLLKKGKIQLNLHDGRNILVSPDREFKPTQTVKISVPDQVIGDALDMKEGALIQMTAGKHMGKVGKLVTIIPREGLIPGTVVFQELDTDERHQTSLSYVFTVGDQTPTLQVSSEV